MKKGDEYIVKGKPEEVFTAEYFWNNDGTKYNSLDAALATGSELVIVKNKEYGGFHDHRRIEKK